MPKRVVKYVNALDQVTTYAYDGQRRMIEQVNPEGDKVVYTYDSSGDLTELVRRGKAGVDSLTYSLTYDATWHKPHTITDPLSRTTTFNYDGNGNLQSIVRPSVGGETPTTAFTHTAQGLVQTITDAEGMVTRLEYNAAGEIVSMIADYGNLNLTTTLVRDAGGNITELTDPQSNTTTFAYDDNRRLTQTVAPSPLSYVMNIAYDASGRPVSVQRQTGDAENPWQTTQAAYTPLGQIDYLTHPNGGTTAYNYDTINRLQKVTDPENRSLTYVYDAVDRLYQLIDGLDQVEEEWTYTADGRPATVTDGNDNVTTYTYDDFDRLVRTTYPDTTYEELTLDDAGRVTAVLIQGQPDHQPGL